MWTFDISDSLKITLTENDIQLFHCLYIIILILQTFKLQSW